MTLRPRYSRNNFDYFCFNDDLIEIYAEGTIYFSLDESGYQTGNYEVLIDHELSNVATLEPLMNAGGKHFHDYIDSLKYSADPCEPSYCPEEE